VPAELVTVQGEPVRYEEAGVARMKILIVSNLYYPNIFGGAERSAQNTAESLVACGHEVVVATLNPKGRYETTEVKGVRVHYLPNRNIYFFGAPKRRRAAAKILWHGLDTYNPVMASLLGDTLDAERPDVVNTHNLAGFSVSAWHTVKKRRLPLVHSIHDLSLLCPRSMFSRGKLCQTQCTACRIYSWPKMQLSGLVDVVTAASRKVLDRHYRYGSFPQSEKIVVYSAFGPTQTNGAHNWESNGTLKFGYLGRLHPSKGIDLLIRSFLELPDGEAKLLMAGKGSPEYEDHLRRLINGHPAIQMLGFVASSEFLSQVDVSVVPSLCYDCAPLAILESMAHHRPLIGARRGGIPELMGEGTGWVFDPDDPGALVRTMRRALESRKELATIGDRAAERARQFSLETMMKGYIQAYANAIDRNNKNSGKH
jgi:glycosyltransferase involved in cell wall biosynthesis